MARRRLSPDARRLEILNAAEVCLKQRGTAVSVDDIVLQAKAAKGTFYTCFPSWDDMLVALRERTAAELKQAMTPVFAMLADGKWDAVFPAFADIFISFIVELKGLHDVLFHSPFAASRPLPAHEKPAAYIAHFVRQGQSAGAYAPIDAGMAGILIFTLVHETADAIVAGADRSIALATLDTALHRILFAKDR